MRGVGQGGTDREILAGPDDGDELPPGYEHDDVSQDGEAINCHDCNERADLVSMGVSRIAFRHGNVVKRHYFCSPACAWADHADRLDCAAEMRAEARSDR